MKFSRLNSTRRLCLSTAMVIVAASSIGAKEYPDSVVLEEVEVSAAAQRNLKSPELGRISLSGDKMLRLPVISTCSSTRHSGQLSRNNAAWETFSRPPPGVNANSRVRKKPAERSSRDMTGQENLGSFAPHVDAPSDTTRSG